LQFPIKLNTNRQTQIELNLLPPGPTFLRKIGDILFKIFHAARKINGRPIIVYRHSIDKAIKEILIQLIQNRAVIDKICEALNIDNIALALHGLEHMLYLVINHDATTKIFETVTANGLLNASLFGDNKLYYAYLNRIRFADTVDLDIKIPDKSAIYSIRANWNFKDLIILCDVEIETCEVQHVENIDVTVYSDDETKIKYYYRQDIPYLPLYDTQEYSSYENFLAEVYSIMLADRIDKIMSSYKELLQFLTITRFYLSTAFGIQLGEKKSFVFR